MSATTTSTASNEPASPNVRFPLFGLLALATAVFTTVITEVLPAGLLPDMSAELSVSEPSMGQSITVYAVGTALTVIPLSAATAGWNRKPVLLTAMAGFIVANTVTAVSSDYLLTMGARFVAGMAAGLSWAIMVGYARRMAPAGREGRAIAIVMAGIPLALALGVPVGTFVGGTVGWRESFGVMTALAVAAVVWIVAIVPDFPGQRAEQRIPAAKTLTIPGVAPIMAVIVLYVVAYNALYTYIAPFLGRFGMAEDIDTVLLVFGLAAIAGIWIVGAHIDRRLRTLTIGALLLSAVAATALALLAELPALVFIAVALWGLGHGGMPTLLQTAGARAASGAADTAQAIIVTLWNAAMAVGGALGGLMLARFGAVSLPWTFLLLLLPCLVLVIAFRGNGFPARRTAD